MGSRFTKENIKPTIIYARSNSIHSRGGTLEHQIKRATEIADMLGLSIDNIFSGKGLSKKPFERKPINDMCSNIQGSKKNRLLF
jgi:predicted site-specific integrase-resolvase